jgi:tetratricopeptide (TPR) repeat protein
MAEGMFEGILGGEDEAREQETAAAVLSAEAFAAAIAAHQAGYGPAVARATERFLEDQSRLLRTQTHLLEDEHNIRLHQLRGLSREGDIRRFGLRLRVGVQIFTVLLLTGIGAGLATMLHDAITSQSVVVESFDTPLALSNRGLSGKVVASSVLDALATMQSAARSTEKEVSAVGAWSSDIRIEVPETGVSIGEISRLLHERFGHDWHINGEVVQTKTGSVVLTVRGDGVPAKSFSGDDSEIDKLAVQAAEYIYGRSQPVEYGRYLVNNGRTDDAIAFLSAAVTRADNDSQRAELINYWGNALVLSNKSADAIAKYRLALSYKPGHWKYWHNLINALAASGNDGEEQGWRESQTFLQAAQSTSSQNKPPLRLFLNPAQQTWDLPLFLAAMKDDAAYNNGAGSTEAIDGPEIADIYALMHDPAMVERAMTSSDPEDLATKAEALLLQSYAALDKAAPADAVPSAREFWRIWQNNAFLQASVLDQQCFSGLVFGMSGQAAEAEAVFKVAGPYARCYAFHGDVLDHAGRTEEAERIWAEGLKIGPDLPQIYLHRGLSEMRHGDVKAAGADFATATEKAPHYADPFKAWGDLLASQGKWAEAQSKYEEALKYAPAWQQLKQARDDAAKHRAG